MNDVTAERPERGTERNPLLERGMSRRDVLKSGAGATATLAGINLLAGCGGSGQAPQKAVRGGTLNVAMISAGKAETMSVWTQINLPDQARIFSVYDPLFEFDANGVQPALAESAEPNADATVWTLRLRQGVTWHDGKPLTADDVVYTMKNWLNSLNYYAPTMGLVLDAKGVRKRDARTIEVPLLKAVADFPSFMCYESCYVIRAGTKQRDFNSNPVGTGPFKFISFVPGQRSVVRANGDYWRQGLPYLDEVIVDSSFTDDNARFSALQAGTADTLPLMPFGLARANQSNQSVRIDSAVGASCYQFAMNMTKPPFSDVRVRQAMRLAADRPDIIKAGMGGYGTPGNDLPGRGLKYFASDLVRERDVEKARFLLRQAGQQNLTVTLETSGVEPGAVDTATVYAQNAAEAGIKVNVKSVDPAQFYLPSAGYLTRPFSWTYPGGGADIPSLAQYYLNTMWTHAAYPETHFGSASDDALLFDAIGELDPAKASDKWHQVQQNQFDRGGYIVYANLAYVDGYRHRVGGLGPTFAGWNDLLQYRTAFVKS
jgi:peptide/nickel transport system substrate-binding protein